MSDPVSPKFAPDKPTASAESDFSVPEALIAGGFLGFIGLGLALLIAANLEVKWTWAYWGQHSVGPDGISLITFDRSAIFRNFGLAALAAIGLGLALWRSWLTHRQTGTAIRQAATADRGLVIDRYQKGALMLESKELSVRIAGVFALRELALSDPDETYFLVLDILYAFVRVRSRAHGKEREKSTDAASVSEFPPDIAKALRTAGEIRTTVRGARNLELEKDWHADLEGANLSGAELVEVNLSGANLKYSDLSRANLKFANLSGVPLRGAKIVDTHLVEAKLSNAYCFSVDLSGANLTNADLSHAHFQEVCLSRTKLNMANVSGAILKFTADAPAAYVGDTPGPYEYRPSLTAAKLETRGLDAETELECIWAFENTPPEYDASDEIERRIALRKQNEEWPNFIDRIKRDRSELH